MPSPVAGPARQPRTPLDLCAAPANLPIGVAGAFLTENSTMSEPIAKPIELLPGDRVRQKSTGRSGFVSSRQLAGKVVVRLEDGRSESWLIEDTELVS